jgi:hypothetical protein
LKLFYNFEFFLNFFKCKNILKTLDFMFKTSKNFCIFTLKNLKKILHLNIS